MSEAGEAAIRAARAAAERIAAPAAAVEPWAPVGPLGPLPGPDDEAQAAKLAWLPRNDLGNACRLIARFGRDLAWTAELGWLVWQAAGGAGVWQVDADGVLARRLAHRTALALRDEVKAVAAELEAADRSAFAKFASGCSNGTRIEGMLREARPYLVLGLDRLDRRPELLNLANGTLELRRPGPAIGEGEDLVRRRDARREDFLTRQAPVAWDPEAPAERWHVFLAEVLPDPAVRSFLQRYLGYGCSGYTGAQLVALLQGRGANGKSTIPQAVQAVLGRYVTTLNFESLQPDRMKGGGQASPDLVDLVGARLVVAEEPESGTRLSDAVLKRHTGGSAMKIRQLNKPFFDHTPTHKLLLIWNNPPRVASQDLGTWRRLALLLFGVTVPEDRRVEDLGLLLAAAEGSGILNWLLDGWRAYAETGLAPPEAVRKATADFQADEDPIADFLAVWTVEEKLARVGAGELFAAYKRFCEDNGLAETTQTKFGKAMKEKGFQKVKGGTIRYVGLRLTAAPAGSTSDRRDGSDGWDGSGGFSGGGAAPDGFPLA